MNADQVSKYLTLPHRPDAKGPDAYDCWNLLRHCRETYFDIPLPDAPIGNEAACHELFREKVEGGAWERVIEPSHGDAALLRGGRSPHVGIYLELDGGGVLHSLEGHGVIWTRTPKLRQLGFARTVYYRINK